MAETIVCPTCAKRFAAKAELMGRRVRCRGCGEPFVVGAEETRETFDLAGLDQPAAATAPPLPLPLPLPTRATGRRGGRSERGRAESTRPTAGASWALSEGERAWLKISGSIVLFGIVGAILPLFGLQFRKLAVVGGNPVHSALGVSVMGVIFAAIMFLRKVIKGSAKAAWRKMGVWGLGATGVLILLVVMAWRPWSSGPRYASPIRMPAGSTPRRTMTPPTTPPWTTPPAAPPATYESLVERFGAAHVVRVHSKGLSGLKDPTNQRIRDAMRKVKATAWRATQSAGRAEHVAAPVADLDAFVQALGPGPEISVDRDARIIKIDLAATRPAE